MKNDLLEQQEKWKQGAPPGDVQRWSALIAMAAASMALATSAWWLVLAALAAVVHRMAVDESTRIGEDRTPIEQARTAVERVVMQALDVRFDREGVPEQNRDLRFDLRWVRMQRIGEAGIEATVLVVRDDGALYEAYVAIPSDGGTPALRVESIDVDDLPRRGWSSLGRKGRQR